MSDPNVQNLIYLLRCAVGSAVPDREKISSMDLEAIYQLAQRHTVTSAVGMALERAGIRDERFVKAVAMAQRKNALLDADRAAILAKMEEAGIWYMPLKGSILKDLYPRFGMREMADNDILFDLFRLEDVRQIMKELGFSVKHRYSGINEAYIKEPVSSFELHGTLFSNERRKDLSPYFSNVKDRLVRDEGKQFGYHFTDEDFYIYMIAHEYKHYSVGGMGVRSLMDTYVYLTRKTLDMDYVVREAEKIGIADFERQNRELALHLFEGVELTQAEQNMLDYMVSSGTFGTLDQGVANEVSEKGRWGYFLSRLTLSRGAMKEIFPVLNKAPFLYPVFWSYRLIRGVFFRNRKFREQLKGVLGMNKTKDRPR